MADPDIRARATSCGGSIHWSKGPHHVADPYIRLEGANLICIPVSYVYFFVGGGIVYGQIDRGSMAGFSLPLGPSLPSLMDHRLLPVDVLRHPQNEDQTLNVV